jgi:hypothetical protein
VDILGGQGFHLHALVSSLSFYCHWHTWEAQNSGHRAGDFFDGCSIWHLDGALNFLLVHPDLIMIPVDESFPDAEVGQFALQCLGMKQCWPCSFGLRHAIQSELLELDANCRPFTFGLRQQNIQSCLDPKPLKTSSPSALGQIAQGRQFALQTGSE